MIYTAIASMGSGKTLFSTLFAIEYNEKHPENKIYANYSLKNLSNFVYTPLGFLPFSELDNCLIILDDILALKKQIEAYLQVIVNASRKKNIDMILTGQYYTFIPRAIRMLAAELIVKYNSKYDLLFVHYPIYDENHIPIKYSSYIVKQAVKRAKSYYDTNEVVKFPTELDYAREIVRISKNKDDIELNLMYFTQSEAKRNKYRLMIDELLRDEDQK